MEALRRIVGCAFCAPKLTKGGGRLVYGVLLVRQAAPMATIDDEDREGERCKKSVLTKGRL